MADTTTSAASHHEKTPAEIIKDKATTSLSSDGNTQTEEGVTTNPDEAHARPSPPSLKSQNTAGTSSTDRGGADDNASMIPLGAGKGDATNTGGMQTPAIEEASFSSTAGAQPPTAASSSSSGAGASLARSNSYILAPTRAEIDVAKAAIIRAVVNCPVDREVSFSQADKGTDTGRIEVRQILKGYKGIDEAIREMNRSNHIRVRDTDAMSAGEAREAFGINDDGEGNLSFAATGAGKSGATTPLLAQGGNDSAAKDSVSPLSTKKSSDILTEKEALATTPIDGPSTASPAAAAGTGAAAGDSTKPDLVRLNTLQREELGKVPDSTTSGLPSSTDSSEKRARSGTNPVGAATAAPGGAESSAPASGSHGTTTGATTSAGNGNADDDAAFTEKLRREIEERAKETKEARAERRQSISGGDNTSSAATASGTSGTDDKTSGTASGEKASAATGSDHSDDKLKPATAAAALPFAAAPIPSPAVPSEGDRSSDADAATSSKPSESAVVPPTIAEEGTATRSQPTGVKVEEVRPSPAQRGSVLSVAEIMAGRPTNKSADASAYTRKEGEAPISAMTETTVTPAPEVDAAIVPTTTIPAKATSSSSHLDTPNQLPAFDFEKHSRPGTPGLSSILDPTTGAAEADKPAAVSETTMAPVTGVTSAGGASDTVSGTPSHPSAFTEEFGQSTSPTSATRSVGPAAPASSTPAAKETSVTYGNLTKPNGASNTPSTGRRASKDNGKSGGFLSGLFRRKSKTVKPSTGSNISKPSPVSSAPAPSSRSALAAKDAFIVVEEKEKEKDAPQTVVDGKLEDGMTVGEYATTVPAADGVSVTGKDTAPAADKTSVVERNTTPDEAEKLAGDAVPGDIPVIEREVEAADPKDANPASSIAPASIVDLQDGPKETVAEPTKSARSRASTRSSSSSVTAEDVEAPLTTTAAAPTEAVDGDGPAHATSASENEPLSKSESRATASREVPAPVAAPSPQPSNARPAPIARVAPPPKKKNRLSLLFFRKKDTPQSASLQTYEPPSSRPPPISTSSPISPAKKDAATDTETDTALSPTSPASFGRSHTRGTTAGTQASIVEHDVRSRVDTEPDDDLESEHEIPDDRSVTAIAASTPLPAPAYSEKTKAKHEKLRKKQEHEAMVKREKERREAELLSKRDKIMNAYTYKQDFSKVPKPSRTKDFGKNIYSSSNAARKEGADPIQHINPADKKEFKAEEKARKRSNSRGSSLLEEQDPNASMTLPTAPPPMFADSAALDKSQTKETDSDAPAATLPKSPKSPKQSSSAAFGAGESSGMERIPTDSNKAATLLGGEPTPSSPVLGSTADDKTALKKRRSTKGTTTTGHKRKSSVGKIAEPTGPVAAVGENGAEVPAGEVGDEHIVVAPAVKGADETGTKDPVADAAAAPAAADGSTKLKKRSSTKSTTAKSASASKPAPLTTVNPVTVAPEITSRSRSASHSGSTLAPLSAVEASGGRKSTAKAGVTELVGEVSTGLKKRQSVKSTSGRSTSGTRRKSVDPNTSLATEVVAEMEKEKEKTSAGTSTRPRSKSKSKSTAPTTSAPAA